MSPDIRSLLTYIGALGVAGIVIVVLSTTGPRPADNSVPKIAQTAHVTAVEIPYTPSITPPKDEDQRPEPELSQEPNRPPRGVNASLQTNSVPDSLNAEDIGTDVVRIQEPYPFPPESFSSVNEQARGALVNILCSTQSGSLRPTSGSGVIIDPRGIILTNAHVAQYALLAESGKVSLSCVIRSGAPAVAIWSAEVVYIPSAWIEEHASDITAQQPTGTGEHDYALLRITGPLNNAPPSGTQAGFSALRVDTREAIGFPGDLVLAASYPAEFIGSLAAQFNLYPVSSITPVQELFTFNANTPDLLSLGGIIEAQSGSSGGPVVNAWGRLIGIITTTSEGATTAERELRALTLSYINRDLALQSGSDLESTLRGDVAFQAASFRTNQAPALVKLLIDQLSRRN